MLSPDDNREFPADQQSQNAGSVPSIWQNGWATVTIIGLNVGVFLLMAVNGVHIMQPETQELLDWGANFKPLTMDGEWWRLITACFLHIGILHLAINMYSLLSVGVLLENMLGRAQYIIAYLVCGLAGSAASLWWHDATVSAGASGAIFGMFGLFYAWVTTAHHISGEEKKAQLASAGTFLVFNLFMGLSGKIDNAAHLGGLVAGIIIGVLVSKWQGVGAWRPVLAGCVAALALSALLIANSTSDVKAFQDQMEKFSGIEKLVNQKWAAAQTTATSPLPATFFKELATEWEPATAIARKLKGYDLPGQMHTFTVHLTDYCEKRGVLFHLLGQGAGNSSRETLRAVDSLQTELDQIMKHMDDLSN